MKVLWFDGEAPAPLRIVLVPDGTDLSTQHAKLAVFDDDLLPDGSTVLYLRLGESFPNLTPGVMTGEENDR